MRTICTQCNQSFSHVPILLKGSSWYYVFDQDTSKEKHNPGPNNECPRALWELARKRRDKYSAVYGKIFTVFFPYCSKQCVIK